MPAAAAAQVTYIPPPTRIVVAVFSRFFFFSPHPRHRSSQSRRVWYRFFFFFFFTISFFLLHADGVYIPTQQRTKHLSKTLLFEMFGLPGRLSATAHPLSDKSGKRTRAEQGRRPKHVILKLLKGAKRREKNYGNGAKIRYRGTNLCADGY